MGGGNLIPLWDLRGDILRAPGDLPPKGVTPLGGILSMRGGLFPERFLVRVYRGHRGAHFRVGLLAAFDSSPPGAGRS